MEKLTDYMVNETVEYSKLENNPMVYTLIIPKVLKGDPEQVKKDDIVKNAVDRMERFVKEVLGKNAVQELKCSFKPYAVMDMFKLSRNYRDTFDRYFTDFASIVCNLESNFTKCMELDGKFKELMASPEIQAYRNTL